MPYAHHPRSDNTDNTTTPIMMATSTTTESTKPHFLSSCFSSSRARYATAPVNSGNQRTNYDTATCALLRWLDASLASWLTDNAAAVSRICCTWRSPCVLRTCALYVVMYAARFRKCIGTRVAGTAHARKSRSHSFRSTSRQPGR